MFLLSLSSIIPLLCLFLTLALLRRRIIPPFFAKKAASADSSTHRGKLPPLFMSIIDASLVWSLALWAETNILSLLNLIRPFPLISFWLLYLLFLLFLLYYLSPSPPPPPRLRTRLLMPLYALCAGCLFAALLYPPNNWDVMSYHLPRVMQWLQNHSLSAYPTSIPRQIGMPPFNSMIALQILAFGGWDHFVNLPQWLAYLGSILGAANVAGFFGGRRARIYSSVFMACVPGAVSQASTIESTLIVTFWLLAFVYIFLLWRQNPGFSLALKAGLCLAFAILSKGSAYPIALPFVLFIVWLCLRHPRRLFLQGCLMALLIISVNMPHLIRAHSDSNSILTGAEKNIIPRPGAGTLFLNTIYNFLVHEPLLIKISGDFFHKLPVRLGLDAQDRELLPWGGLEMFPAKISFSESYGENPLEAIFILVLLMAIILRKFRPPALYTLLVFFSFFFYCLFLTWHPWTGRIHTSLFALASPLAGLFIASWKNIKAQKWMLLALYLYAFLPLFLGDRPLLSICNPRQHFSYNEGIALYIPPVKYKDEIVKALEFLSAQRPRILGLVQTDNALEYPVWAALKKEGAKNTKLVHMLERPWSRNPERPDFVWIQEGDNKGALLPPRILKLEKETCRQLYPPS